MWIDEINTLILSSYAAQKRAVDASENGDDIIDDWAKAQDAFWALRDFCEAMRPDVIDHVYLSELIGEAVDRGRPPPLIPKD